MSADVFSFFAFSGSPRMIPNCYLVMSLGYDFLFFYFRFSSVTAPVLDNEKILHRLLVYLGLICGENM